MKKTFELSEIPQKVQSRVTVQIQVKDVAFISCQFAIMDQSVKEPVFS